GTVAGEHDLPASFVEGGEGVEELLLGRLLPLEELHIVNEQEVGLAKAPPELMGRSVLDRADELVGELFRADECDASVGLPSEQLVSDCLHQVRLTDPGIAVDEKRIVDSGGSLSDSVRSSGSELVRL